MGQVVSVVVAGAVGRAGGYFKVYFGFCRWKEHADAPKIVRSALVFGENCSF